MKLKLTLITISLSLLLMSCFNPNSKQLQKEDSMTTHQTLNGQIVKKEFINKAGKGSGFYEYYLRCSIQDYFIKFCESDITKKDIDALNLGEFDGISVEAEILEGTWDICPNDPQEMQSRIGKYVVIYKVL